MHSRGRRASSSTPPPSGLLIFGAFLFFVFIVGSNHFSDLNLIAFAAGSSMIGSDVTSSKSTCENTQQGKYFITDDRGFTCKWQDVKEDGCCDRSKVEQYSCSYCNRTAECCMEYEYCISCCMHPDNDLAIKTMLMVQDNPALQSSSNTFDFCKARCRTSSESIFYDKEYKSYHKYCYGTRPPSKDADIGIDRAMYEARLKDTNIIQKKNALPIKKLESQIFERQPEKIIEEEEGREYDYLPVDIDAVVFTGENQLDFTIIHGGLNRFFDQSSAAGNLAPGYALFIPIVFCIVGMILFGFKELPQANTKQKIE